MATYKRIASDGRPIEVTDTPAGREREHRHQEQHRAAGHAPRP